MLPLTFVLGVILTACSRQPQPPVATVANASIDRLLLQGTEQADIIEGTGADERFEGSGGLDTLIGNGGRDYFAGGQGNDGIFGGTGDDTYYYAIGDHADNLTDRGGTNDQLVFGPGITFNQLTVTQEPAGMLIVVRTAPRQDSVFILSDGTEDNAIESYFIADRQYSLDELESAVTGNRRPRVTQPLADQVAVVGQMFELAIPDDAFSDPDQGDRLKYSVRQPDSARLPSWLSFDDTALLLSGTPTPDDVERFELYVDASDQGRLSVRDKITIEVVDRE